MNARKWRKKVRLSIDSNSQSFQWRLQRTVTNWSLLHSTRITRTSFGRIPRRFRVLERRIFIALAYLRFGLHDWIDYSSRTLDLDYMNFRRESERLARAGFATDREREGKRRREGRGGGFPWIIPQLGEITDPVRSPSPSALPHPWFRRRFHYAAWKKGGRCSEDAPPRGGQLERKSFQLVPSAPRRESLGPHSDVSPSVCPPPRTLSFRLFIFFHPATQLGCLYLSTRILRTLFLLRLKGSLASREKSCQSSMQLSATWCRRRNAIVRLDSDTAGHAILRDMGFSRKW